MKLLVFLFVFAFAEQIHAQCGWQLDGNDCICMSSSNGSVMLPETRECCKDMGLSITGNVSTIPLWGSLSLHIADGDADVAQ